MKITFSILVSVILLSGCAANFDDVTEQYESIFNTEYKTLEDLLIYGFTTKVQKQPKLDGYSIKSYPGVSGPEIISKSILPAGTKFTIYKVQKCENCFPFPAYKRFQIQLSNHSFSEAPVHFSEHIFHQKGVLWQ